MPMEGHSLDDLQPLMRRIKSSAAGMLPLAVYERLYRAAAACGGGTLVEIGTAGGAATIALALGARSAGCPFHIYTADPFDNEQQREIGSPAEHAALAKRAFDRFGVSKDITLLVGEAPDIVRAVRSDPVALLLLDADGRIDRDLAVLFENLAPDAAVIIDDVDDRIYVRRDGGGWRIDQKHRLSHLLSSLYCDAGLLEAREQLFQTGFYSKGRARLDPGKILAAALPVYRQLVFFTLDRREFGRLLALRRMVAARLPWAARLLRPFRGN